MTEKLTGIDYLRQEIEENSQEVESLKDKFMEDPDYDLSDEVSELAHGTSEALSGGGLNTRQRAEILADYYTGKVDIDDPGIIGELEGDDFRKNVDRIIDAIVYEQAQQTYQSVFSELSEEWQEEYDEKLDAEGDDLEP